MGIYTVDYMNALTPAVQEIFTTSAESIEDKRSEVFAVSNSPVGQVTLQGIGAISSDVFDSKRTTGKPGNVNSDAGYRINWIPVEFPVDMPIARAIIEYGGQLGLQAWVSELGVAWGNKVQKMAADVLNNGFTGAAGVDGVSLFNSAHPHGPSNRAEYSNTGTNVLSAESVEAARVAMINQRNDAGDIVGIPPDTIVVPAALERLALQIANSPIANRENQINPRQGTYNVVMMPHLTSNTAWFMVATSRSPLRWVDTNVGQIEADKTRFLTDETIYGFYARAAFGWTDPRGAWGSTGTTGS